MIGVRLEAEVHIVTAAVTSVQNMLRCIGRAGYGIDAVMLKTLAATQAVTNEEETDLGSVIIDLGGGSTDALVLVDGAPICSVSIPVGGATVTNDISIVKGISFESAERIKIKSGCCWEPLLDSYEGLDEMPFPVTTDDVSVKPDAKGPTSIFVFKTSVEPHIGEVTYFKVMSGTIHDGDDLTNVSRNDGKERISQLYCVAGQNRVKIDQLVAGDIGATVKLKDTRTGNTLDGKGCEYLFPQIKYPEPKYRRAIRAQG